MTNKKFCRDSTIYLRIFTWWRWKFSGQVLGCTSLHWYCEGHWLVDDFRSIDMAFALGHHELLEIARRCRSHWKGHPTSILEDEIAQILQKLRLIKEIQRCKKPCKNTGINYLLTGAGFRPSTIWLSLEGCKGCNLEVWRKHTSSTVPREHQVSCSGTSVALRMSWRLHVSNIVRLSSIFTLPWGYSSSSWSSQSIGRDTEMLGRRGIVGVLDPCCQWPITVDLLETCQQVERTSARLSKAMSMIRKNGESLRKSFYFNSWIILSSCSCRLVRAEILIWLIEFCIHY